MKTNDRQGSMVGGSEYTDENRWVLRRDWNRVRDSDSRRSWGREFQSFSHREGSVPKAPQFGLGDGKQSI